MKLSELGKPIQAEQLAKTIENYSGVALDFNNLDIEKASNLLENLQSFFKKYRSSPAIHSSQEDPRYLRLMMIEQALSSKIEEYGSAGATGMTGTQPSVGATGGTMDPKAKAVMDKVKRKQTLTPDEQNTFNQLAIMAKENKKNRRMVKESEVQQAQVVLAAQDMTDRIQKMMEDISEMQFKDLPALVNGIRNDMGTDQAQSYQASASAALSALLTACQNGKTELESAQSVITGQEPIVPGADDTDMDGTADMDMDVDIDDAGDDMDLSLDANIDDDDVEADLGRERR